MRKLNNATKIFAIVFALIFTIATLCLCLVGCNNKPVEEATITVQPKEDGLSVIGDKKGIYANGRLLSQNETIEMPTTLFFSAGGEELAEAGESPVATATLTATVHPFEATNKAVDWTVNWGANAVNGNKDVTEYVTVTPSSDGSTTATVGCYKGFGSDTIIVSVITREGGFSATCTVRFLAFPTELSIDMNGANRITDSSWNTTIYEVDVGTNYSFAVVPTNSTYGSIGGSFTPNYQVTAVGVGSFNMRDSLNLRINGTTDYPYTLDEYINNTITYQYDTYVLHNRYMQVSMDGNNVSVLADNVVSGLRDLIDCSGRGATGKIFYSFVNNKEPYVKITVKELNTGLTTSVNVRSVSGVTSVSLDRSALSFN